MFIIFGFGKRTAKDYGDTHPLNCGNCNNDGYANLINIKHWFTLLFIPIFPYSSKYYLVCKVCDRAMELQGNELIKNAKEMSVITKEYIVGGVSQEEYRKKIREADLFGRFNA